MAKYTVHGGHAPHGKLGHGAVGFCSESIVDRAIKDSVISWLKIDGDLAVDCTYESGNTQSGVLSGIKKKINAEQNVTANISIHLNANKKVKADNKIKGCECWVYPGENAASAIGTRICSNLAKIGFPSRGIKSSKSLSILKGITNKGANVLVECFFCDDEDDFRRYSVVGVSAIGKAIAEGIVGHSISATTVVKPGSYILNDKEFGKVDLGPVFNPKYYANTNKDVLKAVGSDDKKLFEHFTTFGMKEGRKASADFNVYVYMERYPDLKKAYGTSDLSKYYKHYCQFGIKEGRKGI